MLSIDRKLVKVKKVTPVEEFKGDKRDYGCSVRIEWLTDNTVLDELDKHLRPAFYEKERAGPKATASPQQEMSLPRADVELTSRKCVNVHTPLKLKNEYDGYTIVFHRGATEKSEIKLGQVKLSEFSVDPQDGGSALIACNAYVKPTVQDRGYIDHMAQTEIEITLTPPAPKSPDLVDKAQKPAPGKGKTAAEKANDDPFAGSDLARGAKPAKK
ncbi:hypothetical protein [Burkholderia cenocepacia]|uniref:hypothetical protein n=1 Tax=Burkholderia cenocepacia TaxID=95486 RepID=UPI00223749D1|nr:hypothetical protein [Burkholderia cenocepacia]MCW5141094.1 hypothetical protein [Burkholderia cenocepacia]